MSIHNSNAMRATGVAPALLDAKKVGAKVRIATATYTGKGTEVNGDKIAIVTLKKGSIIYWPLSSFYGDGAGGSNMTIDGQGAGQGVDENKTGLDGLSSPLGQPLAADTVIYATLTGAVTVGGTIDFGIAYLQY